jgi:hypothetical protein|tara:strand:+ start:13009 stop:13374 length:366 start_codon:yes stop_codon:yes gene_type:complete
MLAKPIYESIPYCYVIVGGLCILLFSTVLPTAIGIFLFFNGANIWRLRSNSRRKDHKVNRIKVNKHFYYYEFKPFILFMCGLLLIHWVANELVILAGIMICLIAILIFCLRVLNRRSRSIV